MQGGQCGEGQELGNSAAVDGVMKLRGWFAALWDPVLGRCIPPSGSLEVKMGHVLAVLLDVCLVAQIVIERKKMDEKEKV